MTVLAFASNLQKFSPCPWFPVRPSEGGVFFTDAVETRTTGTYRIGVVREGGQWCSYKAPSWVDMLQQAELYGALFALHLGCYMRPPYIVVRTDSDVGRSQILSMKGGIFLRSRQRMLRQLFWLRSWSDHPLGNFRVCTDVSPADPLLGCDPFARTVMSMSVLSADMQLGKGSQIRLCVSVFSRGLLGECLDLSHSLAKGLAA